MAKQHIISQFETAITELKKIVSHMEKGDLSLEKSLEQFERGIALSKQCQKILQDAEQKVKILTANDNLKDYDNHT